MKIEDLFTAVAHIVSETETLDIEADVNIYNGKAAEINRGRVTRPSEDQPDIAAEFASYTGSNNITFYGEPDTEAQIELMSAINAFCGEVRAKSYLLKAQ